MGGIPPRLGGITLQVLFPDCNILFILCIPIQNRLFPSVKRLLCQRSFCYPVWSSIQWRKKHRPGLVKFDIREIPRVICSMKLTGEEISKSVVSQGRSRENTCIRTSRVKSVNTQAQSSETNAANTLILRGRLGEDPGTINSSGKTNDRRRLDLRRSALVPGMLLATTF